MEEYNKIIYLIRNKSFFCFEIKFKINVKKLKWLFVVDIKIILNYEKRFLEKLIEIFLKSIKYKL